MASAENITANNLHLKQKRARSQLSCSPCRTGKLKCNREKPHCDQCIKRSREGHCIYVPPPVKHKPVQNVKGRIRQLEELVVDLMNQNHTGPVSQQQKRQQRQEKRRGSDQPTPPSDNDVSPPFGSEQSQNSTEDYTPPQDEIDAATTPFGQMRISKNEISYVGESHWGAILNSISDLKRDLGDDEDDEDAPAPQLRENPLGRSDRNSVGGWGTDVRQTTPPQPVANSGLGFMLGSTQAVTQEELIAAMPDKKTADRLLSLWFNSPDPFKGIIHAPTFQNEYKKFWRNPRETPIMWLGLLFAIMSLATSFGLRDADPTSPAALKVLDEVNRYHQLSASAAVLADFTKPREYTIECLIVYTAGLRSNNAFVNVWLMIGLIVRLALRMGYHRDPSHYANITPFCGEMRRRVWAIISMVDVLISFQLGLPSMVKTITHDTQPPRNLLDRDFNTSTTVLPPSRGVEELTPSSYTRAKLGLTRVFANAAEASHATIPPTYEEIINLDRQLEEAKALIPPLLQMPDISELVTDPAEQLMCRFNLDLLHLKTKMVLHRRYMLTPLSQLSDEEQKLGIGRSRKTCTESALRVLQHHHTIYTASQPGGQLESVKWYMGSISTHDFLLAAMIICLELSTQLQVDKYLLVNPSGHRCPMRGPLIEALEKSQRIWAESTRRSKSNGFTASDDNRKGEQMYDETEKAARAMAVMIEKVRAQFGSGLPARSVDGLFLTDSVREKILENNKRTSETQESSPFNGVVSTYDWGDVDGVPELRNGDSPAGLLGTAQAAQPFIAADPSTTVPGNNANAHDSTLTYGLDVSSGMDFSMIGDMLNFDSAGGVPGTVDWEMWDNQVTGAEHMQTSNQPPDQAIMLSKPSDFGAVRVGNALLGGSGVVGSDGMGVAPFVNLWDHSDALAMGNTGADGPLPMGNTSSNEQTATTVPRGPSMVAWGSGIWGRDFGSENTDANGSGNVRMGNMEYNMDMLPLSDVDFNIGTQTFAFSREGTYPTSKDDWADFWRRKRTGMTPGT